MSVNVLSSSILDLNKALAEKRISCRELTEFYIKRAKGHSELNAYISIMEEDALKRAELLDKEGFTKGSSVLRGIPVSLKDIFMMKGHRTTCASRMLSEHVSVYDATVTERLKEKGAVIIGKNNMDEFAMGSSNEHSFYGPVLNPWDRTRVAGGSSGGSAVAVSAGLSQISYGTDTGGSVRLPASYTNICALKPTYGRVSRYGVIAFASSLDQPGPMARNVEDLAVAFDAVAGHDKNDSTTSTKSYESILEHIKNNVKGKEQQYSRKCIGIPSDLLKEGLDKDVLKNFEAVVDVLKNAGFSFKEIKLPHAKYALDVYYIINTGEASSNLARYDGIRYGYRSSESKDLKGLYTSSRSGGFGEEVKRRIVLGTFVLSAGYYDAYFIKAAKVRRLIRQDFENAYKACDVILLPTAPTTAFKIGEKISDPMTMYLSDMYTVPINLASIPSLSFPSGFGPDKMPIGMQILGKHFDERSLFETAWIIQKERPDWFNKVSVE